MASKETTVNKSDAFFQGVSSGSVYELTKIIVHFKQREIADIVNSVNSEGETPLLVAFKEGHYDMAAFLIINLKADLNRFGRLTLNGLDYAEVPPSFAAIVSHRKQATPVFKTLTKKKFDDMNKPHVLKDSISSSILLTRNQKIDMLELLGAAYCMKHNYVNLIFVGRYKIAYPFWLESLRVRSAAMQPYIPKVSQHLSEATRKVFGNASEFTTEEELKTIFTALQNDTESNKSARFYLETQALLMTHRIMSELQLHPHPFFLHNLLTYGNDWFCPFPHELQDELYDRMVDVLLCVTESLRALPSVFRCEWSWSIFEDVLRRTNIEKEHIPFSIVMEILRRFSDFHGRWLDCNIYPYLFGGAISVVISLVEHIHHSLLNETETVEFKQWLSQYMLMMNGLSGVYSPLHFACGHGPVNFGALHRLQVIQLLLEAGANPMATDHNGNSPLHFSLHSDYLKGDNLWTAVQLLLDFGAHLDQPDARGKTPLEMFKQMQLELGKKGRPDPYVDSICNTIFPLQCLCAQVIGQHGIPYNDLPLVLRTFIQNH